MTHCHCHRCICTCFYIQPSIGECSRFCIVRRYRDYFCTFITYFCQEVSIRCTSQWYIGTPCNDVTCIVPVTRFWSICLFTPNLWAGWWQVSIPVIEGKWSTTHKVQETRTTCIGQHGHSWNYRESCVAVWTICFCCI